MADKNPNALEKASGCLALIGAAGWSYDAHCTICRTRRQLAHKSSAHISPRNLRMKSWADKIIKVIAMSRMDIVFRCYLRFL